MEVCCSNLEGFPEGSVISIRVGTTRRQAPISALSDHSLKFPQVVEPAEPLRIDVLKPVGSHRLVLVPEENLYRVSIEQENGHPLNLSMQVRTLASEATGKVSESPAPVSTSLKYQDAAGSARKYLEDHQLLMYFQGLLHAVIQEKPSDPYLYMWEQIGSNVKGKRTAENGDLPPKEELERAFTILQQQLETTRGLEIAHRQRIESLTSQLQQATTTPAAPLSPPPAGNSDLTKTVQKLQAELQQREDEVEKQRAELNRQQADALSSRAELEELQRTHMVLQQQLEASRGFEMANRQRIETLTSQLQQAQEKVSQEKVYVHTDSQLSERQVAKAAAPAAPKAAPSPPAEEMPPLMAADDPLSVAAALPLAEGVTLSSEEMVRLENLRVSMRSSLEKALENGIFEKVLRDLEKQESNGINGSAETQVAVLTAANSSVVGEAVLRRSDKMAGEVLKRTTTDMLVRMSDNTEVWYGVEDLAEEVPPVRTVTDGDMVLRLSDASLGPVISRTTTDLIMSLPDGTQETLGLEDVGQASEAKIAAAKSAQAKETQTLEVMREQVREALETAFLSGKLDMALQSLEALSPRPEPSGALPAAARTAAASAVSSAEVAAPATQAAATATGSTATPADSPVVAAPALRESADLNQCSTEELMRLKVQVREALEQAMDTGDIVQWLQGISDQTPEELLAPPAASPVSPPPPPCASPPPPSTAPPPLPREAKPAAPAELADPVGPLAGAPPAPPPTPAQGVEPGEKIVKRDAETRSQLSFLQARVESLKQDSEHLHQQVSKIHADVEEVKKQNETVHQLIQSEEVGFAPSPRVT